jgi:Domain of unknown function (DUF5664)
METNSKARKQTPVWSGVLQYFPKAIAAVARVSFKGNEKHNPGQKLHWSRGKSDDHEDCIARHMMNPYEKDEDGELHIVHVAWRAMAAAELALERQAVTPVTELIAPGGLIRAFVSADAADMPVLKDGRSAQ